jgi:hypothetical protein
LYVIGPTVGVARGKNKKYITCIIIHTYGNFMQAHGENGRWFFGNTANGFRYVTF